MYRDIFGKTAGNTGSVLKKPPVRRTLWAVLITLVAVFAVVALGAAFVHNSKSDRLLTTEQAALAVRPCVVGIIQYSGHSMTETGEGSGIVLDSSGNIVTNNHVVEGSSKLVVVTDSGKKYEARLIGADRRTDLAVVNIGNKGLPAAAFGDSKGCHVGQQVIAVGNPSGITLAGSVTQGIISALGRNMDVGNGPMDLIQTDAAINPGNSGGALADMYGRVVGINSAKIVRQGYEGLGFSIPVSSAAPVVKSILKYGYVKGRVSLGIRCSEIDAVTSKATGLPPGMYVESVVQGGSAGKCGIRAGDDITAADGNKIRNSSQLITARDAHRPGGTIELLIYRRSEMRVVSLYVKLTEDRGTKGTISQWTGDAM